MINETKNHHFVSQVEQRLNSINPEISKNNQRIYSFSISNRENHEIQLESENGVKIRDNLSFDDLFTIDLIDSRLRANLEKAFCRYEQNLSTFTNSLLEKIKKEDSNISDELLNIFALKFINSFRNPYCIEKTLNTVGNLSHHFPTDENLKKHYRKIDTGNRDAIKQYAIKFNVTELQYRKWLKCLFMLLVPKTEDGFCIVDTLIINFFRDPAQLINICINTYSEKYDSVLLSDRGFTMIDSTEGHFIYEFNLTSNAFISYVFTDIKKFPANKKIIDSVLESRKKSKPEVKVHYKENDLEILTRYNKLAVYQSHSTVYCKSQKVYGL